MKNTLGEILKDYIKEEGHDDTAIIFHALELMKRAYNQALKDVKGNVKIKRIAQINSKSYFDIDMESIDKLKIK